MNTLRIAHPASVPDTDWTPFPGGELEGAADTALCPACRLAARDQATGEARCPALCFQCFRLGVERNRKLREAGDLNTASEARFQTSLPFEPVNHARLTRLKAERQQARTMAREGVGVYIEKRRRAQVEARHALVTIFQGLKQRRLTSASEWVTTRSTCPVPPNASDLQLPASWLPFVAAQ